MNFFDLFHLEVVAQVTHPPGTLLDDFGRPVLDPDTGQPLRMDTIRQEKDR